MAVTMVIGNESQRSTASLFATGQTIAAVLANEFSEATGDMYTFRAGGTWAGAVRSHDRDQRPGAIDDRRHDARKDRPKEDDHRETAGESAVNNVMLSLLRCVRVPHGFHSFLILGYLVYNGANPRISTFSPNFPWRGRDRGRDGQWITRQRGNRRAGYAHRTPFGFFAGVYSRNSAARRFPLSFAIPRIC